jgi:diguanylate cyclase (GGDEF)-like protein
MIIAPTGDGDYLYRHYGREIIRYVGGNRLGERVSIMTPQVARFTIACYDQALADGRPAYTVHRSLKSVRVCLWERLILPATARDGSRFLIVFSRPLQFREELLTTVLDTSPSGIIALRAVRDRDGAIASTIIITANRRAAQIAGLGEASLLDEDARATLPFFRDGFAWNRCLYAIDLRRSDSFETSFMRDGEQVWLKIAVAPLGDGLVLTLTDISDLMTANLSLRSRAASLALEIGRERATRRALSQEIGQREEREQELRRLAETDPLTALLNRRSFIEKANMAIAACDAAGQATSLIIVDLDHFKSVNDGHGHAAGDAIIRAFADLLLGMVRSDLDLVGRFGGEEFAIFLPRADTVAAQHLAQRVKDELARRQLPVSETLALQVSASFGVATRLAGESFTAFIERADRALYRAKHEGRDCIRLANPGVAVAA